MSCHDPTGVCELPMQSLGPWALYETEGACGVQAVQPNPEHAAPQPGGQFGPEVPAQSTSAGTGR